MLTFDNLVGEAMKAIPEFAAEWNRQMEDGSLDAASGNHIVFGYAFVPILILAIKEDRKELVTKMLSFVEEMAKSQDHLVGEVCDFAILERLHDEIDDEVLVGLLGETTREDYALIKRYMM